MVDLKSLLTMQGMMFVMLLVGVFLKKEYCHVGGTEKPDESPGEFDPSLQYSLCFFQI